MLASSAIPVAFPAIHVSEPDVARGWYSDGGARLNTPIKPALALGATRVVVVALSSLAVPPGPALAGPEQPDALEGVGQVLSGLFGDGGRRVPSIVIAPPERDAIARRALAVAREHYARAAPLIRHPDISLFARIVGGGTDVGHAEVLSFLLFTPEFARALTAMGQQDAKRWLQSNHDGNACGRKDRCPSPAADPPGSLRAADARSERAATPTRGCT